MTVWAVSMVKDEVDVISATVSRMLLQVDRVLIADNGSVDGTREVLDRLDVEVLDDPEPAYYQSAKMTSLADRAREAGATWIVPFDADEVWLTPGSRIATALAQLPDTTHVAAATLYDHVATGIDPDSDPVTRMGWRRRDPVSLPKVACRALPGLTIHQGNHGAAYAGIDCPGVTGGELEVRHFPYRSAEQFVSKVRNGAAAYAATDLPEGTGAHWRQYGRHLDENGEQALVDDVFRPHFFSADPEADETLVFDPCP